MNRGIKRRPDTSGYQLAKNVGTRTQDIPLKKPTEISTISPIPKYGARKIKTLDRETVLNANSWLENHGAEHTAERNIRVINPVQLLMEKLQTDDMWLIIIGISALSILFLFVNK